MARKIRSFHFDGEAHHLQEEEAVRVRDLQTGTVTLVREADGAPRVIRAADLNVAVPGRPGPVTEDRLYDLRAMLEETLALGFTDEEIIELLEIARRHQLLRIPCEAGGEA